ncbi:hypothetical protein Tco_0237432 [Tanacetum coccineum]
MHTMKVCICSNKKSVSENSSTNGVVERRNRTLVESSTYRARDDISKAVDAMGNLGQLKNETEKSRKIFQAKADIGISLGMTAPYAEGYKELQQENSSIKGKQLHVNND